MQYEYAVTEEGLTPSERAIKFATWEETQNAIWLAQQTAPKNRTWDDNGDPVDHPTQFVVHARLVGEWAVVEGEQTAESE